MASQDARQQDDIPEGSVAGRVLEARYTPRREARRARDSLADPPEPAPDSPTALVLERSSPGRAGAAAAVVCAAILHGGLLAVAVTSYGSGGDSHHVESPEPMQVRHVVPLESEPPVQEEQRATEAPADKPQPPEPKQAEPEAQPTPQPKSPPESKPEPPADPSPRSAPKAGEKAAAKAGDVVEAKADAPQQKEEVADFTDFEVPDGEADGFAGGVTAPSGTADRAVRGENVEPGGGSADGTGDGAGEGAGDEHGKSGRGVGLVGGQWDCAWPKQAKHLSIDEEVVVLRAVVRADGSPASISVVSDPGHGFGRAARECARSRTFRPATNADGEPYRTTSPRIRVRFTR